MGMLKGKIEYQKFKAGATLSFKQGVLAQCYCCNGFEEGGVDCKGSSCPLYQFMPYREDKPDRKKRSLTPEHLEKLKQGRGNLRK